MTSTVLFKDSLKHWLSARGLALVLIAIMVPPALTAAWVFTHQNDVAVTSITWDPDPELGDFVNFTVTVENQFKRQTGAFNVTLRVGYHEVLFERLHFRDRFNETQRIDGLGAGESRVVVFRWNSTAEGTTVDRAGSFVVEAFVDSDHELKEIEEKNNHWQAQVTLAVPPGEPGDPPALPEPSPSNATRPNLEAEVVSIHITPEVPVAGDRVNITVTVRNHGPGDLTNASLAVQLVRESPRFSLVENVLRPEPSAYFQEYLRDRTINLTAGQWDNYTFSVPNGVRVAPYFARTGLFTLAVASGDDEENNLKRIDFRVDRKVEFVPPPPQATAKDFYHDTLEILQLRFLIPLVALFFAAGVLQDERDRGNLPYLLTRPIPRWALPVSRFAAGGLVAGVAILAGVLLTMLLLLGMPQDAPGFLYWPLFFSWLTLLVYGALFTLLGVAVERPYLWGLGYILGVETAIQFGRSTEYLNVNGEPILQSWAEWISLNSQVTKAFNGWIPGTVQWWPEGEAAARAMLVLVAIGIAALAGAAWWMRYREFE
jgi:hypothetical protein